MIEDEENDDDDDEKEEVWYNVARRVLPGV